MAGWILTVDKHYPQHIDYALRDGFWDTSKRFGIQPGDDVFFWLNGAGGGLMARCRATSSLDPIDGARQPWDDGGVRDYRYRVHLEPVAQEHHRLSWADVQALFGSGAFANTSVIEVRRSEGLAQLQALFPGGGDVGWNPDLRIELDEADPDSRQVSELLDIPSDQDERLSALRSVVVRRGQPQFRRQLLERYRHCLVTGSSVHAVLEAAHISPYRGDRTNDLRNGLLLRADIHTLFDLSRLTVLPDSFEIRVAPELLESRPYGDYDTHRLTFPPDEALRPDRQMLERHNQTCEWL